MAGSVNKCILVGNIGKKPDVRRMTNGKPVVTLSIETTTSWTDKETGQRRERSHWHKAVILKERECELAERLSKGALVYVEGKVESRKYTDKRGVDRYVTEVVVEGFNHQLKNVTGGGSGAPAANEDDYGFDEPTGNGGTMFDDEDNYIPMGG